MTKFAKCKVKNKIIYSPQNFETSPFRNEMKVTRLFSHSDQQSECQKVLYGQCHLRIQNGIFNVQDEIKEIKKTIFESEFRNEIFRKHLIGHFYENLL